MLKCFRDNIGNFIPIAKKDCFYQQIGNFQFSLGLRRVSHVNDLYDIYPGSEINKEHGKCRLLTWWRPDFRTPIGLPYQHRVFAYIPAWFAHNSVMDTSCGSWIQSWPYYIRSRSKKLPDFLSACHYSKVRPHQKRFKTLKQRWFRIRMACLAA